MLYSDPLRKGLHIHLKLKNKMHSLIDTHRYLDWQLVKLCPLEKVFFLVLKGSGMRFTKVSVPIVFDLHLFRGKMDEWAVVRMDYFHLSKYQS